MANIDPAVKQRLSGLIVMMGTDPQGQGGIATVVQNYRHERLLSELDILYISTHRNESRWLQLLLALGAGVQLAFVLCTRKIGVVHVHCASSGSFWRKSLYLLVARVLGSATIFHLHGAGFDTFYASLRSRLMQRWISHTITRSSLVLALSNGWKINIEKIAPNARVEVLVNSVPIPEQYSAFPSTEIPTLLFLGRVGHRKGIFDLIDALVIVAQKIPNIRLLIGGDGDLEALQNYANERQVAANVKILGWLSGADKATAFGQAHVFVLPAYQEGLPMSLLEAMSLAKAVITTPVGGIPDVVVHGENGILITPGDSNQLAMEIERVFGTNGLLVELGKKARATVEREYSSEVGINRLVQMYQTALDMKM